MNGTFWIPDNKESDTRPLPQIDLVGLTFAKLFERQQSANDPQLFWSASNFAYLLKKLHASSDEIKRSVTIDPQIMHGNPVFSGTRIPLYEVLEEFSAGTTMDDLLEGYPTLRRDQVQSGLVFVSSLLRIYNDEIPD